MAVISPRTLSVPNLSGTDLAWDDSTTTNQLPNSTPPRRPIAIAATSRGDSIYIYTQDGSGFICERSYDPQGIVPVPKQAPPAPAPPRIDGWRRATLLNPCATWSTLCCLSWGELDSTRNVSVFYEAHDNALHEMRYDGRGWNDTGFFQPNAMPGTAIAEVHNENGDSVLLFFQDAYGFLSYRLAINWVWEPTVRICQAAIATPIAATTWSNAADIRLYFVDKMRQIREFSLTFRNNDWYNGDWVLGSLRMPGLRTSSMAAISWPGPQIRLYIARDNSVREIRCGPDFVYNIYPHMSNTQPNGKVEPITAIAKLRSAHFGFSHLYWAGADKIIRQRTLFNTQKSLQSDHSIAVLRPPISALSLVSTGPFHTFGNPNAPLQSGPVWNEPRNVDEFVGATNGLHDEIQQIVGLNKTYSQDGRQLSSSLIPVLRPLAETAVAGIVVLARSIEELSSAAGDAVDELVAKCKAQSITIAKRFEDLSNAAHSILASATDLATDITALQGTIQLKMARITALQKIGADLRRGEESVIKMRQDEISTAQQQISMLEKAAQAAQHKRDEAEKLRILRDVLTFGAGEIGDWGSLNEAINHANELIGYSNAEITASQAAEKSAQAAVDTLGPELGRYTELTSNLDGLYPVLQSLLQGLTALSGRVGDFEKSVLDGGVVLSGLVGKSSVLPVKHAASQLAASVLAIEEQLKTSNRLTGVFFTDVDSMDDTLHAIANSPVEPSADDDLV